MIELICRNLEVLKQLFNLFSEKVEGVEVIKLTNNSNGGAFKLLESYDLIPTYVNKGEAKVLFSIMVFSQVSSF